MLLCANFDFVAMLALLDRLRRSPPACAQAAGPDVCVTPFSAIFADPAHGAAVRWAGRHRFTITRPGVTLRPNDRLRGHAGGPAGHS